MSRFVTACHNCDWDLGGGIGLTPINPELLNSGFWYFIGMLVYYTGVSMPKFVIASLLVWV